MLRRLSRALRRLDGTAITVEFVMLVLGVFLGMQVSNWNTERAEQRQANDALRALAEDLRLSIKLTQANAEVMTRNAADTDLVLARLRDCELSEADRDRFASGLYTLGKITPARLVRTTFDELRDSGRLGLMGDAELRRALSEVVRRQESHDDIFKLKAHRMDPHIAYVDSQVIFDVDASTGGYGSIRWKQLDMDFSSTCKDRRFQTAVAAVRNYTYDAIFDLQRMQQRYADLGARINKEKAR